MIRVRLGMGFANGTRGSIRCIPRSSALLPAAPVLLASTTTPIAREGTQADESAVPARRAAVPDDLHAVTRNDLPAQHRRQPRHRGPAHREHPRHRRSTALIWWCSRNAERNCSMSLAVDRSTARRLPEPPGTSRIADRLEAAVVAGSQAARQVFIELNRGLLHVERDENAGPGEEFS